MNKASTKNMTLRYLAALGLLAVLSISAYLILQGNISDQETNAAVINVSGRQRMLSQRTALLAHELVFSSGEASYHTESAILREKLLDTIGLMEKSHEGLINGDRGMSLPGNPSAEVRAMYFQPPMLLDSKLDAYLAEAKALVVAPDTELTSDNPHLEYIEANSAAVLGALDALVKQYQEESESGIAGVRSLALQVLGATLFTLLMSVLFVFRPMVRRIQREVSQLNVLNETLEQRVQDRTQKLSDVNVELERDITERKRAEEALRNSEERYRALVETSPDVIYTLSPDGTLTSLNPAFETVTGWSRAEWIGKSFAPIIHPDDRLLAVDVVQRLLREEEVPPTTELRVVTKSGEYITGEFASTLQMQEDKVLGVLGIVRDITERKRAEEELRESEARKSAILETALDCVITIDHEGRIIEFNPAAEKTFGYGRAEVLGRQMEELIIPPSLRESHRGGMASYLTTGEGPVIDKRIETTAMRADGTEFPAEIAITHIPSDGPLMFTGYIRDITERKQAEEKMRRLNEELEKEHREIEVLNSSLERRVKERTQALRLTNEELRERNRQFLDARAQAATDGLTGLRNHRTFQDKVRAEVSRAQASGTSLGLIMMDIDGFKGVNDSLGHQAGDDILLLLAQALTDVVQWHDAYRYGGDEFAVLLPGSDGPKAARIAERLRRVVAKRTAGNGTKVTVSLGIADFPHTVDSADQLIYGADAAMYWAKSAGKNRVGDWSKMLEGRAEGSLPWYAVDRSVRAPDVVSALVAALAAKDPVTAAHTERCSWYTAKLAEELGLGEEETSVIRLASLLHDIGKLAVPDEVLFKPGPLNEDEWAIMKQHPTATLHVLGNIRSIADATPAILHHHEHFDGSGYPDGLAGEDIPLASRILLVTDAFDAMTTDRPYREAMPVEAAIEELERNKGSQFDPVVVEAFLRILARDGAQPLMSGTDLPEPALAGSSGEDRKRR